MAVGVHILRAPPHSIMKYEQCNFIVEDFMSIKI